jgi:hypothetical protein
MKSDPGPPMTLGGAAAAQVRLIVWCKNCQHQVEPDPAKMAERYGASPTTQEVKLALAGLKESGPAVVDWAPSLADAAAGPFHPVTARSTRSSR